MNYFTVSLHSNNYVIVFFNVEKGFEGFKGFYLKWSFNRWKNYENF